MSMTNVLMKRAELKHALNQLAFDITAEADALLETLEPHEIRSLALYGLHRLHNTGVDRRTLAPEEFWNKLY